MKPASSRLETETATIGVAVGAGDLIGLAGRLYIATETVTASGAGT